MDLVTSHGVELGVILGLVTFFLLWIYSYSLSLSLKPGIPKGRFWQVPFIGESLELRSGVAEDFLEPRIQRYGRNFRTHLFGSPCICVTSFDKMKFVLQTPHAFKRFHPLATKVLVAGGDDAGGFVEKKGGSVHRSLSRNAVRGFLPELDRRCRDMLANWERMGTVSIGEESEQFAVIAAGIFNCDYIISKEVTSPDGETNAEKMQRWMSEIRLGLIALPLNLPGTPYHRAVKVREEVQRELSRYIGLRRAEKGLVTHHDVLDYLVQAGEAYSESDLADVLMGFLFAALETSATLLTWLVVELLLRPELLALVREENDRLAEERRKRPNDTITMEDIYENLTLTNQVVQETLRLRNVAAFVVREAAEDIVHDGMLFPKGWKVMVSWVPLHKDPNNHTNPGTFNPFRFQSEGASKPSNYMPFSIGPGYCKGQDAFKVEAAIVLHYLLSGYDFKPLQNLEALCSDITYWPTPRIQGPVRLSVSKRRPEAKSSQ